MHRYFKVFRWEYSDIYLGDSS